MEKGRRTVQDFLFWGRGRLGGGDGAFLEAEILLGHAIGRSREWMLAHGEDAVTPSSDASYSSMVERRASTGMPIAQLVGHREFAGMDFIVRPGVLVPRPETEALTGAVLEWLGERGSGFPAGVLVDAGCGSGIIAVTLARNSGRTVYATDISKTALEIASENAVRHGVQARVKFLEGSWLEPVRALAGAGPVCAVVSNPPYIPSGKIASLHRDVRDFEPREALDGGVDGLDSIRRLAVEAGEILAGGGLLAMEIGDDQWSRVEALLGDGNWVIKPVVKDMAGLSRVIMAEKGA